MVHFNICKTLEQCCGSGRLLSGSGSNIEVRIRLQLQLRILNKKLNNFK